ncbi:hypothetical protein GCM10009678_67290 [Actinomadura kijaniata]|uniref:Uncharacterized protein n=1 Tax=Actinomadura namibiensis TaxID=182080 RepID=A0A7W3LV22_ACTNM|nr:hypothetical protein [Actinomadura namibiensis]MBA8954830.1 hypothetical protein [Actinomadura namibiensis]
MAGWRRAAPGAAVMMFGAGVLAGCDGGSPGGGASPKAEKVGRPSVVAMSVQEYGSALAGAIGPLDTALRGLNGAGGYRGLAGRVRAAERAAEQGVVKLRGLAAPQEVSAEHGRLVAALQVFQRNLGGVRGQVEDRKVCTGSVARAEVGGASGATELRRAVAALEPKVPGWDAALGLPSGRRPNDRPANGTFIRSGDRGGRGTLTIDNGGSHDAVITLARSGRAATSVYVREGDDFTVRGVPDGRYSIYYTTGGDWDRKVRAFGGDCAFRRFDDEMAFKTERTATQIRWSTWKITLQPVVGGTASTSDVAPDGVPD